MNRRGLKPGDGLTLEFERADEARVQRMPARVIARDQDRLLAVVSPIELAGFDVDGIQPGDEVLAHWRDNGIGLTDTFDLVRIHDPAVGVIELAGASTETDNDRRGPRLHYRLDAKLWTPEYGVNAAVVVDLGHGGARVRVPSSPTSDVYELQLAIGDESVDVRAQVIEVLQSVHSGSFELRVRFVDVSDEEREILDRIVTTGVDSALEELRARLLEPTY